MKKWKRDATISYGIGMIVCTMLGYAYGNIIVFIIGFTIITAFYTGFNEIQSQSEARQIKIRKHQESLRLQSEEEANKVREQQDLLRIQAQREYHRKFSEVYVSTDREDYIVKKEDYKRGNSRENEYRRKYLLPLLNLYDTKCAKCGKMDNGFDLDHFFLSKNEGGNFSLLHKDGHLVNNAIPLCQSCNRAKGDRPFNNFFDREQILFLFTKNREMTLLLNQISFEAENPAPVPDSVSFSLPADIGRYIVAKPNQSEWLRQDISEAVAKEQATTTPAQPEG